jgi:serine/threonine-protein kinase RsbW
LKNPRPENALPRPIERSRFTMRMRTFLPSTKQALNGAVRDVISIARRCGCVRDNQADLEIALREALANAIIHGNANEDGKRIFLRCYGAPGDDILILVRDEGEGFDPERVPDPRDGDRMHLDHGRGLLLMRELMDHIEYRRAGREVMIYKSCVTPRGSSE